MTETGVAFVLSKTLFRYRRFLLVPNVSYGLFPWEVDLAAMTPRGYVHEIEVKTTSGDLRRDLKKDKHNLRQQLEHRRWFRFFWYAMPKAALDMANRGKPELELPADAGIITIEGARAELLRKPKANPHAEKLSMEERYQLARLGTIRYWARQNEVTA